jgi:hypothetical protein
MGWEVKKMRTTAAPLLHPGVFDMSLLQSGGRELHKLSNDEDNHVLCRFNKFPNAAATVLLPDKT